MPAALNQCEIPTTTTNPNPNSPRSRIPIPRDPDPIAAAAAAALSLSLLLLAVAIRSSAAPCGKNATLAGLESELLMVQHQLRGVAADDFGNLTAGFPVSALALNHTTPYRNETLTVPLMPNVPFNQIRVLGVYATASDFGRVVLRPLDSKSSDLDLSPAPAPSPGPSPPPKKQIHRVLLWILSADSFSIGLEGAVES